MMAVGEQWRGLSFLLGVRIYMARRKGCIRFVVQVSSREMVQNILQEAVSHRNESGKLAVDSVCESTNHVSHAPAPDVVLATVAKRLQIEPLQASEVCYHVRNAWARTALSC